MSTKLDIVAGYVILDAIPKLANFFIVRSA